MKQWLLKFILILSILSFCTFLFGFVQGARDVLYPQASDLSDRQSEEQDDLNLQDGTLHIVGLGDSLTRGVGDSEGLGYLGRLKNRLMQEWQIEPSVTNLAISGAKSEDLLTQIQKAGVQYSISKADVIILTIGGNDLHPGWEKLEKVDLSTYKGDVEKFRTNSQEILKQLRAINGKAPIYWIGLYNPFEDVLDAALSSKVVIAWNDALQQWSLEIPNTYVIPVFDLFKGETKSLLYSDHFHPNEKGYELIADRILQKLSSQFDLTRLGNE